MSEQFKEILNHVNIDILLNTDLCLVDDGIIDSMDIMNLIAILEEKYEINFDPDDIIPQNFNSAQAIWELYLKTQKP